MLTTIPLISIIIAVAACLYASYSDLKEGVIRNKLTFPLIAIGIILNAAYVFTTSASIWLFIECVVVTVLIFVLGVGMLKFCVDIYNSLNSFALLWLSLRELRLRVNYLSRI